MSKPSIDFEIIWRKIHGTLSEHEEQQFSNWLNASDENRRYFKSVRIHYEESATPHEYESQSIDQAWSRINKHFTKTQKRPNPRRWIWSTLVACIVLLMTFTFLFTNKKVETTVQPMQVATQESLIIPGSSKAMLVTSDGQEIILNDKQGKDVSVNGVTMESDMGVLTYKKASRTTATHELIIPRGGKFSLILEDGTKVWINSESSLKYPATFAKNNRTVHLTGEAYFDVTEDPDRPFMVITDEQTVSVLGTEFNVSAYKDQKTEHTTLVEGKVAARHLRSKHVVTLTPGDQLLVNKVDRSYKRSKVDTFVYSGWKDDLFVFENESLGRMLNTLSRWYDVEVFYNNPQASEIKFTGEIERYESFENILKLIEKTNAVTFEVKNRTVIVN